jgi:uncharacterized protein
MWIYKVPNSYFRFSIMEFHHYIIAIAAGFMAGIINTLAGSGSLFTLPVLLFLGLSPHHANGTNRVGILAQTLVGAITLYRRGNVKIGNDVYFIIPTVLGSILGAIIAVGIDEETLRITIGVVMLFLLVIILARYNELLRPADGELTRTKTVAAYPLLFVIGVYGGFIQLGVGIFTLAALLLVLNFTFRHANALKNIMNFFLTLPAFIIFAWNGHVVWEIGCVVAIGQTFGAWVAARYATQSATASTWIRRLLVVMTLITTLELFGVFDHLRESF